MTSFTPNFDLPYPSGTDAPCDFPEQWCAFTDAMQAVLDTFQSAADRTSTVVPIAQFRLTQPLTLVGASSAGQAQVISFDTVSSDTADWIDFDSDTATLVVNRAGRFYLLGNALYEITTNDGSLVWMGIGGQFYDTRRNRIGGRDVAGATSLSEAITVATPYQMFTYENLSLDDELIVFTAYFTAVWIADEATP